MGIVCDVRPFVSQPIEPQKILAWVFAPFYFYTISLWSALDCIPYR